MKTRTFKASLSLYFSLPFYPVKSRTFFYHGHLALGIEDTVYQIYNPKLLKSDFLVSVMPVATWLYENDRFWIDRDPSSRTYKHVHLYRESELAKTKVYFIKIDGIDTNITGPVQQYFKTIEEQFQRGELKFNFLTRNCASLLNAVFYDNFGMCRSASDGIPSVIFRKVYDRLKTMDTDIHIGKLDKIKNPRFRIHRYCLGINSFSCEKYMDGWIAARS
ncbi:MAG: hypothetical protein JW863_02835 [Chitinispirillaceae bacterium]|nr:hypothetical protein [Chitinispirillaceae bacterium]